jgi:hypothetical protein
MVAAATRARAGPLGMAGLLSAHMLVHGLHRATRLPLWGCYGLIGGALGPVGIGLLDRAPRQARHIELVPQTAEALQENVAWLKQQAAGRT